MTDKIKAVVLAAGKSKRMKTDTSKIIHKIAGKEIINFLIDSLIESGLSEDNIIIVTGNNLSEIKKVVKRKVKYTIQPKQLGTAHALLCAHEHIADFAGDILVTVGDNPYVTPSEFIKLINSHKKKHNICTLLSAIFPFAPPPYGRIIRNSQNMIVDIVEAVDASEEQLEIKEVNSSIYMFNNKIVFPLLSKINNKNKKGEYYLTDIIDILNNRKHKIEAVKTDNYHIAIGINNRWELQQAHHRFNQEQIKKMVMEKGVTVIQPETVTIEFGVDIGKDTIVFPSTYIGKGTKIGRNCHIGPFTYLKNVTIKDNETVSFEKRINEEN